MVFDAHTECIDQYRQQNAAREVSVVDEALYVLSHNAPFDYETAIRNKHDVSFLSTF